MTANIPGNLKISTYQDVPNDAWFKNFVMAASKLGIVKGYSDGEFKPGKTITISEMTKILIKVKQLKENSLLSQNSPWKQKLKTILDIFSFR